MRLSVAIMTHNEAFELRRLMQSLRPLVSREDVEVVVVDDFSGSAMQETFADLRLQPNQRLLNGNFAAQRNFSKQLCKGDYILFLDPDEIPAPTVCAKLMVLCDQMEKNQILMSTFPRMNVYSDDSDVKEEKRLEELSEGYDWTNPDYQLRLCRNEPHIHWKYSVHEKLVGESKCYMLSPSFNNCLVHIKSLKKQVSQNNFYDQIDPLSLRNIAKRLKLRRLGVLLGIIKAPRWIPLDLAS